MRPSLSTSHSALTSSVCARICPSFARVSRSTSTTNPWFSPASTRRLSFANLTVNTPEWKPGSSCSGSCVGASARSPMRCTQSDQALATAQRESLLTSMLSTDQPTSPTSTSCTLAARAMSYTRTVPLLVAATSCAPSGVKAAEKTGLSSWSRRRQLRHGGNCSCSCTCSSAENVGRLAASWLAASCSEESGAGAAGAAAGAAVRVLPARRFPPDSRARNSSISPCFPGSSAACTDWISFSSSTCSASPTATDGTDFASSSSSGSSSGSGHIDQSFQS
mmetsp:Transcript_51032/g.120888  ORF Transcript_51032/g.120888 Transcript_51032/m.120888 type:complete len:278 (-) Transcript_51032:773-1606(-)